MKTLIQLSVACLLIGAFALNAEAADVRAGISTRETYVGLPVTFQVQISNATDFEPPKVPEVPGLRIESVGQPSRSTQTTIINGSMSSRSSVTYSFAVTPLKPGNFRIPPISVQADGKMLETRPFEFVASTSETGDLLFVEVFGKEKQIYVGQALDLQLQICVRPYRDKDHNVTLSEADMWQLIAERTSWGPFQERIEQFAANNQRPVGTEVLRKDRDGADHSYYLFEIDATIYPKKPGRIDADDVQVVALYPTAISESQDPFGGMFEEMGFPGHQSPFARRLAIESFRPITAEAKVEPIEVLEIPIADRPADYRGAVGKYRIFAEAKPKDVKAGDPITLYLNIAGTGPMDLVQAPPLAELPALAKNFKVPNEPLAGYVQGTTKGFATTIRPRTPGLTEIPAIPFTYFDPEIGKFVTDKSKPIKIQVEPADTLALEAVVGRSKATASAKGFAAIAAAGGPVLINVSGDNLLTSQSPATEMSQTIWLAIVAPPVAVLGMLLARSGVGVAYVAGRFRSASRKCQAAIAAATTPAEVGSALKQYLAKREGLSASADPTVIVGALRAAGHRNPAVRCERLLEQCDEYRLAGFAGAPSLSELKQIALQMMHDLETESSRPRPQGRPSARTSRQLRATTAIVAFAVLAFVSSAATCAAEPLTASQLKTVLAEASEHYNAALAAAGSDSADSKEAFAAAAEKYQLLVDSGISNGSLYLNLGNAYLESGATGRAIANYRRSLEIDPSGHAARTNLDFAENAIKANGDVAIPADSSFATRLEDANDLLIRFISPRTILSIGLVSWFVFWCALGLRIAKLHFPWKSVSAAALMLSAVAATSFFVTNQLFARTTAIVISSSAVHSGDGEQFPALAGLMLAEGQSVDFLRQRGKWTQIRTDHGQIGWLPSALIETL